LHYFLLHFSFFIDSIIPQTEESSDAPPSVMIMSPPSVMIISPPSVKDKVQASVGYPSEAVTPVPLNIGYNAILLL
jgi:hypothetical protein